MCDRVLLVSGGGRGIGAATSRLASERGYRVAVNYRVDARNAHELVARIERAGSAAVAVQADIADPEQVERLFSETEARLGAITHVVNSAGITGPASRLDQASVATLQAVLEVNVLGTLLCARGGGAYVALARRKRWRDRQPVIRRSYAR
jgi:NAD(P)-dependent dehydrogenase (short-subunit alcohol dehydrogenase family)